MKKFLLSMAAVALMGGTAIAEEVTFDFENNAYGLERVDGNGAYIKTGTTITSGDVSITLNKTGGNGWRLMSDGLRAYRNSGISFKVSVPDAVVTGIALSGKSGTVTKYSIDGGTDVEVTEGSFTWTNAIGLENPTVALTIGSNGAVKTIKVTYEPAGNPDLLPANISFPETSYSVIFGDQFNAPVATADTNADITYSSGTPSVATVDATTGAVEILAAGTTTITARAEANSQYNAGSASYTLTVIPAFTSIANAYAHANNSKGIVNFPLTVTYQNGINTYVTDGTDFTLVYGTVPTYEVGDVIPSGWEATYTVYKSLPELKVTTAPGEAVENGSFIPREVTEIDDTMLNEVCILKGVTFDEATIGGDEEKANFTGYVGETEYTFRNNFADVASVEAGEYDVLLAVAKFDTTLQLYPISYSLSTGIENVEAARGEAQYFNLQGVRVANPENGMFIRVQNGKAQKIVIK